MADFKGSGYEWFVPGGYPPYELLPSDLSLIPPETGSSALAGIRPSTGLPLPSKFFSGVKGTSSQRNFFYDVIHIYSRDQLGHEIPADFSLGAITADTLLKVYLWNAYFDNYVDLQSVTATDSAGIQNQFPGNPPFPVTLQPFEEILWDFLVQKDVGPASFNSVQTVETYLQIGGLIRLLSISIRGSRADLWAFAHNWANACTETLEWLTALNIAHDGTEHRAALRDVARRYMDVTLYLTRDSARKLEHLLYARQPNYFITPIHPFGTKTTAYYISGSLSIYCNTVGKGFVVGTSIILFDPLESTGESMSISAVFADHLDLVSGGGKDWPQGSVVYPAGAARLVGDVPLAWETKDFATATARLELQPTWVPANSPHSGDSGYETYSPGLGGSQAVIEVLNHEPDWAGGLQRNFSYESGVTDSQTGALNVYETRKRPARTITHNFLLRSPQEILDFRAFLYRRRGRATPFWAPSWVSDFRSMEDITYTGGTELWIHDNGFMAYSKQVNYSDASRQERTNLQIELKNGTLIRSRIAAVDSVDVETTHIVLASTMLYTFKSSDIKRISWLNLYRLADDSVTFEWLTHGVARVALPMTTVPDYLVDPGYEGEEEPEG